MTVERKFDAKSMLGMLRRYEATVGDLFAVVPPLMSRDSVKAADIDGVTLRRISVKDLTEGILMPEEKVEGVELIRVDAANVRIPICLECNDAVSNYGSAFATCWTAQQRPVTT